MPGDDKSVKLKSCEPKTVYAAIGPPYPQVVMDVAPQGKEGDGQVTVSDPAQVAPLPPIQCGEEMRVAIGDAHGVVFHYQKSLTGPNEIKVNYSYVQP